ncbi:hypothetical protein [Tropicimonas sp. IMCC34043]|uniref:hypothetical protein n=1 Tax=Tropicimonas sp. IMCC34043 TaxID=2248760 RepID=UPI000E273527|nr:hypothetical protein [Tropicimonas sp. IMCC34043]
MFLEDYDRIRASIQKDGFTPTLETRISLFLTACKAVNLPFLSLSSFAPAGGPLWQASHSQLFRESEAMALLMRVTHWSMLPLVYVQSAGLTAPIYAECLDTGFTGWPASSDSLGIEAMALGHALLATVRLTPIVPAGQLATHPYAVALMRIEQENGRLLQTQIRRLKDGYAAVPIETREEIIARKTDVVKAAFGRFLQSLA